ncbi:MAG: alpha-mannosidase [Fimbriimonadaceae bacterium]|jgi:alpha-mannosidase|nr:alpha-mannosidase [Fimbriimonadaceae bacterium]
MLKHPEITHRRVRAFIAELKERLYGDSAPLSVELNETPAKNDAEALEGSWRRVEKGFQWGPAYRTVWFRITGQVPPEFGGKTIRVMADVGGERTVWRDGSPVFGVDLEHTDFGVLSGQAVQLGDKPAKAGDRIEILMQAYARNPQVRVHGKEPKREQLVETVGRVEIVTFDPKLQALLFDVEFGFSLLEGLPKDDPAYATILRSLNEAINTFSFEGESTIEEARKTIQAGLQELTGRPKHMVTPVGHAHLDTAWLWPIEITKKKMAHTTATQLALMERYPWYVFAHSQASQYEWLEKEYPQLFERVKAAIKKGQWEPVGSMWVEADCNIPSGESLVRQFLYGRKYFREKLGYETEDMFLPDVFGYSAALPQILAGFGIKYFLTQKISWNQTNKFPHNTFWWQGIDGTVVWSHFPPADTYCASAEPAEILKSVHNHKDQARSDESLYLFGFGDGGGGPTERHLELLERARTAPLLPEVKTGNTVLGFYKEAYENSRDLATWVGELYLEFHRGTYTSQAAMKLLNRECEMLLRDAELLASFYRSGDDYPREELETAWKQVLLNQFHDIIPGSSVHEVYEEARETYRQAYVAAYQIILDCIHAAAVAGADDLKPENSWDLPPAFRIALFKNCTVGGETLVDEYHVDGGPPRSVRFGDQTLPVQLVHLQPIDDPEKLGMLLFETPRDALGGIGIGQFSLENASIPYKREASPTQLESEDWLVELDKNGNITGIQQKSSNQEFLQAGQLANVFQLLDDRPLFWSAWDVDPYAFETARDLTEADSVTVVENGPVRVAIEVTRSFSKSKIVQRVSLGPTPGIRFDTEVDWHEADKMLKVAFPVAINSSRATYEIQYGHTERYTHYNTSWDMARFEVCAQKWVDLSEGSRGVALLNNCKYGHDIHESVIRLTLLRSPKAPDPECDMGVHRFSYILLPHQGSLQEAGIVHQAYALNAPVHYAYVARGASTRPLVEVDTPNLVVESVKKAEDDHGIIVRLYECHNTRGTATLRLSKPMLSAQRCNLEEQPRQKLEVQDGAVSFSFRPFEIITLRLNM